MAASSIDQGFDRLYGLEMVELDEDRARARVSVHGQLRQPNGFVHGGVYAAIAEGLTSLATGSVLAGQGLVGVGLANHTSVLHPISDGTIEALAVRRHRGRTTWVWEVELRDGDGRLCVTARTTIAVQGASDHRGAPRPSQ